ncbi:hypothetical protein TcBrA4_0044520 [Trypanosoma cruzi]|nr:hypothetical protein TcBrA4_0044520 [Trypanosoma cruzi]
MPTAVSLVATWAAEHSLKINADRSGAALFCIASHRQSDEDTADHRLGDGIQHVKSHPVRLLGNAIGRHLNFGLHVTVAAMWTVSRRHQLRLDAEAGASRHTTAARQSHRVRHPFTSTAWKCGTATAALHRSAHAHQRRILLSTWPPIQHRCGRYSGFRAPTKHKRLTLLRFIEDVRGAICLEAIPSSILGKAATTPIALTRDAVINGLHRVCNTIGIPHSHNRAPHIQHRIFPLGHCALQ